MITYVSAEEAFNSHLAYVQDDETVIMTVDTASSMASGSYRKSCVVLSPC
jgi:3-polyprenyl-4-hydroxybenzoate decarboxylase